jgi:hypothetical protein
MTITKNADPLKRLLAHGTEEHEAEAGSRYPEAVAEVPQHDLLAGEVQNVTEIPKTSERTSARRATARRSAPHHPSRDPRAGGTPRGSSYGKEVGDDPTPRREAVGKGHQAPAETTRLTPQAEPGTGSRVAELETSGRMSSDPEGHALLLAELTPAIEAARVFAQRWEEPYRPDVFRVALEILTGPSVPTRHRIPGVGEISTRLHRGSPQLVGTAVLPRPSTGDRFSATEKLSRALDTDVESVDRIVEMADDGKIHILARIDGKTKKDLQTRYSLAYLYVKEVALGERMVDVEELRSLCIEHACYDVANFTGNFGKDAKAGLIRQHGEKGSRGRKFLLSKKGLDEAATLLHELVNQ